MKNFLSIVFLIMACSCQSFSQEKKDENRVHAGVSLGLNMPYIFGSRGLYGPGPNAGVYSVLRMAKHWAVRVEVRFSRNASHIGAQDFPRLPRQRTQLDYAEVPLMAHYIPRQGRKGPEISFTGGAAYTRLVGYKVKSATGEDLSDQVKMYDRQTIVPQLGIHFHKRHFGGEMRLSIPTDPAAGFTMLACFNYQI